MTYVDGNPKSKAEIRRWLDAGKEVTVYEPGLGTAPANGKVHIEGPHYPKPHTWWGTATLRDGRIVEVK